MNREEELFQKRLIDLASQASLKGVVLYSDFMNLNEINIFHNTTQKFSYIDWKTFGGYECAERQMVAFLPDAFSFRSEEKKNEEFPISCIRIEPLNEKFAGDLSHRDYLGAILNLGIERSKIGDILIIQRAAYLFCSRSMAAFLGRELTRVGNTVVKCVESTYNEEAAPPRYNVIKGTVASVRLDSLLALAYKASRSSLTALIEEGKVFVNGKLITSNGYSVKEGDIISARGMGRFRYKGVLAQSKKGRYFVEVEKFI